MEAYSFPAELKYTASHLWVQADGEVATVGITVHGQERYGKVYYVGLPAIGAPVSFGMPFGYLQSAGYGLTQLFPPVQGEIVEINDELWAHPARVNDAPHDEGWLVKIKMSHPAELDELEDVASYEAILRGEHAGRRARLPRDLVDSDKPSFLIDERRRILSCNAAAERLIGLSSKELQHGPLCSELFGCHLPADGEPIGKHSCPGLCSMLNLEPITDAEYVVTNASGGETTVQASYLPVAEPGQPRRAVVVLTPQD